LEADVLRADKVEIIEGLRGVFQEAGVIVVAHYQGLSVPEITDLRRQMRDAGGTFRVTKNRLARRALEGTPCDPLGGLFQGPTAIAFSSDPVAAPKVLVGYARRNDKVAIIGGALAGRLLEPRQVRELAELPSIEVLRARLLGVINAPASKLARLLQTPGSQLARVLQARSEQGEAA
jgi:large subunit ribosomal protein L10